MQDFEITISRVGDAPPHRIILAKEIGPACARSRYDTLCVAVLSARERGQIVLHLTWTDVLGPAHIELAPMSVTRISIDGPGTGATTNLT